MYITSPPVLDYAISGRGRVEPADALQAPAVSYPHSGYNLHSQSVKAVCMGQAKNKFCESGLTQFLRCHMKSMECPPIEEVDAMLLVLGVNYGSFQYPVPSPLSRLLQQVFFLNVGISLVFRYYLLTYLGMTK